MADVSAPGLFAAKAHAGEVDLMARYAARLAEFPAYTK